MPLTPEQFDKLVTKNDLKGLEKKMDKKFDAAFDLFATKNDLKGLEKKMDKKFDAAFDLFATKEDLKELEKNMATKTDVDKILAAVDGIAKKHQDFEAELAANLGAHDRFEKNFVKTDKRVKILEKKLGVSRVAA